MGSQSASTRGCCFDDWSIPADKGDVQRFETAPCKLPFVHQALAAQRSTGLGTLRPFTALSANGSFIQEQSPGKQPTHGIGCALMVDVRRYRSDMAFRIACSTGE